MANSYTFTIEYPASRTDKPTFDVVNFQGTEALSTLYRFAINLRSETANVTDVLGLRAVFTITVDDRTSVYHGILTEFQQTRRSGNYVYYQAALSPKVFNLSLYRQSDVFICESFPDILDAVLTDAGFVKNVDYETALSNTGNYQPSTNGYNRWSYVCQYEETCLDFLSRLMEREGIYYYFKQKDTSGNSLNQELMVITDTKLSHAPATRTLVYRPVSGLVTAPTSDDIQDLVMKQKTLPGMTKLMNYNYENASLGIISAEAYVSNDGNQGAGNSTPPGVVTIYGENFANATEGKNLAVIRAQELFCQGKVFFGDSTVPDLMPGYIIQLVHPNEVFNDYYLVRDVTHKGYQQLAQSAGLGEESVGSDQKFSYQNSFYFIPDTVQFRPPRITIKPKIHGTMNAVIDGEQTGTPAEMDATGRYKVKLPFLATPKNGGKGSVWIRMATPYAGSGTSYGMHFPLHIGAEVVLSFRDGDPDLPVISGAVYNSLNLDVVNSGNPVQHIIQTPGSNKILMDDTQGAEYMYLYSPYDKGSWVYFGKGGTEGELKPGEASDSDGESRFHVQASGDKHELTIGQEDDFVIGSLNIGVLGSRFEIDLGMTSDIHMGTMFAADLGETIDLNAGWNLELGEKHDALKKEQSMTAHDSVQIAAGSDVAYEAVVSQLQRVGVIALATGSALLAAAGGDISGAKYPSADKPAKQSYIFPGVIAAAIALHVAAYAMLRKITTDLADPKSTIELDANGIILTTQPLALNGIQLIIGDPANPGASIEIQPDVPSGKITLEQSLASITLDNDNCIALESYHAGKITVDDTKIEIVKQPTGGMITVDDAKVKVVHQASNNYIGVTASGCQMKTPNAEVDVTTNNAYIKFGGSMHKLGLNGVTITGTVIQLN